MPDVVVATRAERPGIQAGTLGITSLALLASLIYLDATVSSRQGALWVVGGLLCLVLYHAWFGFARLSADSSAVAAAQGSVTDLMSRNLIGLGRTEHRYRTGRPAGGPNGPGDQDSRKGSRDQAGKSTAGPRHEANRNAIRNNQCPHGGV